METRRQKRHPEKCQTEAGGQRGRETETGQVGGKTKLEDAGRGGGV